MTLEMAQRLSKAGENVGLLVCWIPTPIPISSQRAAALAQRAADKTAYFRNEENAAPSCNLVLRSRA